MGDQNAKKFIANFLFIIVIIAILLKGMEWERYLKILTRSTYNPYPHIIFVVIFPMVIGILLALPNLIKKMRKAGSWKFDWILLAAIGIPTLYTAMSPALSFSPISKFLPKMTSWLFAYSFTPQIICGVVFGYVLLSVFDKQSNE